MLKITNKSETEMLTMNFEFIAEPRAVSKRVVKGHSLRGRP